MNLFKNLKTKLAAAIEDYWIWIFVILILSCGCSTWKQEHTPPAPMQYERKAEGQRYDGGWKAKHNYYVIDANADVPDAYFETKIEAMTYQKDFAEYHDYVIVKMDDIYKVYHMEILPK